MKSSKLNMSIIWSLLIAIMTLIDNSNGVAVMSIDIGSESMKVAIVSVCIKYNALLIPYDKSFEMHDYR